MKYKNFARILFNYATDLIYIFCTVILFWVYKPNDKIDVKYFVFIIVPLAIFTVTSMKYLFKILNEEKQGSLPKIKSINNTSLVLGPNEYFAQDIFVCIYLLKDEFEIYIGYGYVETIQAESKNIQIKVEQIEEKYKKYLNNKYRSKIFVKPCINRQIYNNWLSGDIEEGVK